MVETVSCIYLRQDDYDDDDNANDNYDIGNDNDDDEGGEVILSAKLINIADDDPD